MGNGLRSHQEFRPNSIDDDYAQHAGRAVYHLSRTIDRRRYSANGVGRSGIFDSVHGEVALRIAIRRASLVAGTLAGAVLLPGGLAAQAVNPGRLAPLQWRLIGPFRGGRTVGATGVP